eukprot:GHVU01207691.1.p1 GENE.GHVU01207691.1~~GHVU01207691.1.p1  ORF type:complete len:198 (-),score=18.97 GHVU01207691.1:569-1162(-)
MMKGGSTNSDEGGGGATSGVAKSLEVESPEPPVRPSSASAASGSGAVHIPLHDSLPVPHHRRSPVTRLPHHHRNPHREHRQTQDGGASSTLTPSSSNHSSPPPAAALRIAGPPPDNDSDILFGGLELQDELHQEQQIEAGGVGSLRHRLIWLVGLMVVQSLSSFILKAFDTFIRDHRVVVFYLVSQSVGGWASERAS